MPNLTYTVSDVQAARMIAATRNTPAPDGSVPPVDASNAVLWAHTKKVFGILIKQFVKGREAEAADDLDSIL